MAGSGRSDSMRELSLSDVSIRPVSKKDRVVSLTPAAPSLKLNLKMEDVVAENASWSGACRVRLG